MKPPIRKPQPDPRDVSRAIVQMFQAERDTAKVEDEIVGILMAERGVADLRVIVMQSACAKIAATWGGSDIFKRQIEKALIGAREPARKLIHQEAVAIALAIIATPELDLEQMVKEAETTLESKPPEVKLQ